MFSSGPVRIIVLSGYPVVRAGLRCLLELQDGIEVVAESASASEAIDIAQHRDVDVALVDPDAEGITLEAVSGLAGSGRCRILVFSAARDQAMFTRAIELGASGVVMKDQPAELLVRAIRKVHAGEYWLDRARTASLLSQMARRGRDPEVMKIESLTKREREIVALLGEGLNNIAVGERLFISEATVRNHLTSILSKLGLANRFELAVFAFRNQLIKGPGGVAAGYAPRREEPRDKAADRPWRPQRQRVSD